jgi:fructokinase
LHELRWFENQRVTLCSTTREATGLVRPEIVCIGEVLFDVFGELELLAGAPLNVTAHLRRLGHPVGFVSAVGKDTLGMKAVSGIEGLGIPSDWVIQVPEPTGRVQVTISNGEPAYSILRGVAYEQIALTEVGRSTLEVAAPAWIYYGTLAQSFATTRASTRSLIQSLPLGKRFYDLNLRVGFESEELILDLLGEANVAKLNHLELDKVRSYCGWPQESEETLCRRIAEKFSLEAVCVTRGAAGAGLLCAGRYVSADAARVEVIDTVGAGDAFAAALLHGLSERWPPEQIIRFGNALGGAVASRRGAIPDMSAEELRSLIAA